MSFILQKKLNGLFGQPNIMLPANSKVGTIILLGFTDAETGSERLRQWTRVAQLREAERGLESWQPSFRPVA